MAKVKVDSTGVVQLGPRKMASFQQSLLAWFEQHGREFPWRLSDDPFQVLVAEKLLQQTAARPLVIAAFNRLMHEYPTHLDLAHADIARLVETIQPLGFTFRAGDLKAMAQAIEEQYGGEIPSTIEDLKRLPGVGEYAARAVMSFARGADIAIVDTNIARFLYRVCGIQGNLPLNPARKRSLIELASQFIPQGRGRDYNLAVLDLCAAVCRASKPMCRDCPVRRFCDYGTRSAESSRQTER